ncbi:hypothetical protein FPOAC2_00170 [Fusarium poae]|uniref:hypothetical protein n=1 Tax=Fusarium poae TaxID=36050 RepID=UPI001CE9FDB5|nr:hypothetical protein FPOAC1_000148 [Fusarium poae]KAG8674185.1 hypothetical protein FPOAC1_000148 [Fusarium poae]
MAEDKALVSPPTLEVVTACHVSNAQDEFLYTESTVRVNGEYHFVMEIYQWFDLDDLVNLDFSQLDLTGLILEEIPDKVALAMADSFAIESIKAIPIPVENICPRFTSSLTAAPERIMDNNCFFKYARLDRKAAEPNNRIKQIVLMEAKACEVLMKHPHPNVAKYWGCYVVDGRIRALCYQKYIMTLKQRKKTGIPLNVPKCLRGIRDGICHMHSLGLIHNDINPNNIMIDEFDNPVIIDFDSCTCQGEKVVKGWTRNWCMEGAELSSPENDFYGLRKIEEYLLRPEQEVMNSCEDIEGELEGMRTQV